MNELYSVVLYQDSEWSSENNTTTTYIIGEVQLHRNNSVINNSVIDMIL